MGLVRVRLLFSATPHKTEVAESLRRWKGGKISRIHEKPVCNRKPPALKSESGTVGRKGAVFVGCASSSLLFPTANFGGWYSKEKTNDRAHDVASPGIRISLSFLRHNSSSLCLL
ncbi:hypothetical protein ACLOJK_001568 [Asimina triloba]